MHAECAQEILDLLAATPIGGRDRQYHVVVAYCENAIAPEGEVVKASPALKLPELPEPEAPPAPSLNDPPPETPEVPDALPTG